MKKHHLYPLAIKHGNGQNSFQIFQSILPWQPPFMGISPCHLWLPTGNLRGFHFLGRFSEGTRKEKRNSGRRSCLGWLFSVDTPAQGIMWGNSGPMGCSGAWRKGSDHLGGSNAQVCLELHVVCQHNFIWNSCGTCGAFFGKKETAWMSLSEKNVAAFQYHIIKCYKLL
jgi:hypothetical protein